MDLTDPESSHSPVKIASELEEKTFPSQKKRRQSSGSVKTVLSPSPRRLGPPSPDPRPKLSVGRSRKISEGSLATPIPTVSDTSDHQVSPHTPLLDVLNIREISEVISELEEMEGIEEMEDTVASLNLSEQLTRMTKVEVEAPPSVKKREETNPFHFQPQKLTEELVAEPKKSEVKNSGRVSNKKRLEIQESLSSLSVAEVIEENLSDIPDRLEEKLDTVTSSKSESVKEEFEKKKERRKWQTSDASIKPVFKFKKQPQIQTDSSVEGQGQGCYYCRNVCEQHQKMLLPHHKEEVKPEIPSKTDKPDSFDVGIQAGKTTVHHYLFDPTLDPILQPELGSGSSVGHISTEAQHTTIIQLMKKQLELTERHMKSQQALYRSYCSSLEKAHLLGTQANEGEKILYGRSRTGKKLTFEEALRLVKEEMAEEEKQQDKTIRDVSDSKARSEASKSRSKSLKSRKNQNSSKSKRDDLEESIAEEIGSQYEHDFEEDTEISTETGISTENTSQN